MITLLHGDAREMLATLPAESVQCVITSPPYYGLRAYSDDPREIGREETPAAYVAALVAVFRAVWRVLRDDGTLWLNLGDSYAAHGRMVNDIEPSKAYLRPYKNGPSIGRIEGFARKQLLGMPWRVAFALQDAGWILRSDIIWSKPNPMPESVRDRPTRAHEYLFLFAKQQRYYYDATAIAEAAIPGSVNSTSFRNGGVYTRNQSIQNSTPAPVETHGNVPNESGTRNRRSVWTIATQPYAGAHFATMPEALIEPCVLAGSASQACETCGAAWRRVLERERNEGPDRTIDPAMCAGPMARPGKNGANHSQFVKSRMGDPITRDRGFAPACACATNTGAARSVVLDPFAGSGTVMRVAERFGRDAIGIDLSADYIELQEKRLDGVQVELFR